MGFVVLKLAKFAKMTILLYNKKMASLNKIKGLIFGSAIADALGFICEYKKRDELEKYVEELFDGELKTITHRTHPINYQFGQYSDDTQFSLLLLTHLINRNRLNPKIFLKDLKNEYAKGFLVGLGGNTKKLLSEKSSDTNNSSNGSLMRSYPIGLFYNNEKEILLNSKKQSSITHSHKDAILASQCYAVTVHLLLNNQNKKTILNKWTNYFSSLDWLEYTKEDFIGHLKENYTRKGWEYVPPGAEVSIKAALYCFYNTNSYEECLKESLLLGGDTDTVASLSCGLMGLCLGFYGIPNEWRNILIDKGVNQTKYLESIAEEIFHYIRKNN